MKPLILILLTTLSLCAQEVADLGVMTNRRLIRLERPDDRPDFLEFKVELHAQRWPSNSVTFSTTNEFLRMRDFISMPPGPCVMGVRSICADGDESPVELFKLDVRREPPKRTKVTVSGLLTPDMATPEVTTAAIIDEIRAKARTNSPPPVEWQAQSFVRILPRKERIAMQQAQVAGQVLPNGTNQTYSEKIVEMQRQMEAAENKRRNE